MMKIERKQFEADYGQVWDTNELQQDFIVHGFLAPFVVVTKKETNEKGTLMFSHRPRYYYSWTKDELWSIF